ncbi:DUF1217 domain-containing protein [Methylobacterium sp. SI9]|uniref:DUF1217 domain-containing protein n=1 Tax=Methylobacterium guangdongense TaxID=3138811 RepID=UPI00313BD9A3
MFSTFTDYRILTSNFSASVTKKASEPATKKDIQYFQDNIGKVKTIDDFLGNQRLYTFAMKAYGLDDMIPNKGFIRKVLLGEADANGRILVNRLQDSRYQDFAAAFNFREYGDDPAKPMKLDDETRALIDQFGGLKTVQQKRGEYDIETENTVDYVYKLAEYTKTPEDIAADSKLSAFVRTAVGLPPASADDDAWTQARQIESKFDATTFQDPGLMVDVIDHYRAARQAGRKAIIDPYYRPVGTYAASGAEIGKLKDYVRVKLTAAHSAQDIVNDPIVTNVLANVLGLPADMTSRKTEDQAKLIGQKLDVASLQDPKKLNGLLDKFTALRDDARTATVNSYIQQSMEDDAGAENEGTRLALYFRRKVGTVKSAYGLLADPALAEVVRTAIGLPAEAAKSSIETQARLVERKIDLSSLKDPAKLDQFIKRFTLLWDSKQNASPAPAFALLTNSVSALDSDVLLSLQNIRGGF